MARHHLHATEFSPQLVEATERFFASRPWWGETHEQVEKFTTWLKEASESFGVATPELRIEPALGFGQGFYFYEDQVIIMGKFSVVTLFHEFWHHVAFALGGNTETDARDWSLSLFYRFKPFGFRKRVREGRILFVRPRDLLSRATIRQMRSQGLSPDSASDYAEFRAREQQRAAMNAPEIEAV